MKWERWCRLTNYPPRREISRLRKKVPLLQVKSTQFEVGPTALLKYVTKMLFKYWNALLLLSYCASLVKGYSNLTEAASRASHRPRAGLCSCSRDGIGCNLVVELDEFV